MKTTSKNAVRVSKKQKILIGIAGVVVILCGWWAAVNFLPHPLGDKMEYIGKEDFGGWFIKRYSVYYYGTDMTAEEVAKYFDKLELEYPIEQKANHKEIWLKDTSSGESAKLYFYETTDQAEINFKHASGARHVIKTSNENYSILRASLR